MLLPEPAATVDVASLYAAPARGPVGDRPWVAVNMITTVDGAATDPEGRTGGLANPGDREAFVAIRAVADVIVAGAGTVRAEDYGRAKLSPTLQEQRVARSQAPRPRIAVISATLRLDPGARLFEGPEDERPLVVTVESADPEARRRLAEVADIVVAGERTVEWPRALAELRAATGADVAVVEGGPTVNGQLLVDDLVDEMCVTVAPVLAGGDAPRIAHGLRPHADRRLRLAHALEDDGYLLLRYVADRSGA
ncbi:MAG TPA: dihydrofolate reductase family protein [Acidimicrobiales bacterium]